MENYYFVKKYKQNYKNIFKKIQNTSISYSHGTSSCSSYSFIFKKFLIKFEGLNWKVTYK